MIWRPVARMSMMARSGRGSPDEADGYDYSPTIFAQRSWYPNSQTFRAC